MTVDTEEVDTVLGIIAVMNTAIDIRAWSLAREAWAALAPLHPMLIRNNPRLALVDEVFAREEALLQLAERQSHCIH